MVGKRRVVVTGLGMISPLGLNVRDSWEGICAGRSGIRMITDFDASDFSVKFAGTVLGFDPAACIAQKDIKKMDISLQYGFSAAVEAFESSGLLVSEENEHRIGVAIGSGIGGLSTMEENFSTYAANGPGRISPFFIPAAIINMISGHVAIRYGLKGPNIAIVTACTSGVHNIGYAARTIQYGDADVMLAGGAEKASSPLGIGGFAAARALSKRNEDPTRASRPWDKDRDGFVLGDGAGVMVLEEYEHAKRRGAKMHAEIVGFGMSADAYHMTLPDGVGAYHAMRNALLDAAIPPTDIDYVNAHGTSTPAGDVAESQAVEKVLGEHSKRILMSSTKSMTGHLLGAAGAIESVFSVLAMRDQLAPPTINLEEPGEGCVLNYVPGSAKSWKIQTVLKNSFGFGGTNASLVFRKVV